MPAARQRIGVVTHAFGRLSPADPGIRRLLKRRSSEYPIRNGGDLVMACGVLKPGTALTVDELISGNLPRKSEGIFQARERIVIPSDQPEMYA